MNEYKTIVKKLSREHKVDEINKDTLNIDGKTIDLNKFIKTEVKKTSILGSMAFGTGNVGGYDPSEKTKVYDLDKIKKFIKG